ncbi:hypothetical protein E2562_027743 [Oryza meyeriana var. granulata]|uniref:Rx N-terminal domain-containing protein n=1 Tax=Oryza meyeriana var. granulata TaxID=110450 RepID=A0A6G1EQI9_9ORYZ|nr:hypothetical protein E2562_004797 [Oryza meyeriana var. granulata]KAF0926889.1 hypothetical protein E2562_027743 [Oryza meyeriana var. granulata]
MEAAISAILTELAGRSISFLVGKYLKQQQQQPAPSDNKTLDNLQRLLLRFRVIVDEAEARCITNQAMLLQLGILRKEMFIGYYMLDTFRGRAHQGKDHGEVRTFGSMDASEHPEMASIATDIAVATEGCFMGANVFSRLMRSNANTHYWSLVLATLREFKKKNQHVWSFMYGADQVNALDQVTEPNEANELLVIIDNYQTGSHGSSLCEAEAEAPKISL